MGGGSAGGLRSAYQPQAAATVAVSAAAVMVSGAREGWRVGGRARCRWRRGRCGRNGRRGLGRGLELRAHAGDEPIQVRRERRLPRVEELHRADEVGERPLRHDLLEAQRKNRQPPLVRVLDLARHLLGRVRVRREQQYERARPVDAFDDGLAVRGADRHVARREPDPQPRALDVRDDLLGRDVIFGGVADEDVDGRHGFGLLPAFIELDTGDGLSTSARALRRAVCFEWAGFKIF